MSASLVNIWAARSTVDRALYVSGLGADGEPTARWFEIALLLLVAGGYAVAWALRGVGATGRWTPASSVAVSASFFLVASQVPCTYGCPVPLGDTFSWQDLTHVVSAVAGFSFAVLAMAQVSLSATRPVLRHVSRACGVLVAVIAAAGGLSCLLDVRTDIGSLLEFVATTVGMGWLVVIGVAVALSRTEQQRPSSEHETVRRNRDLVGVG
ncbi:MAG TPA: DUF998 domain-containing protein [Lentzea sp.]